MTIEWWHLLLDEPAETHTMRPYSYYCLFLVLTFHAVSLQVSNADPVTHVYVTETKISGIPAVDSEGPSPADFAEITGGSLTTGYTAMAEFSIEDFSDLKTKTFLSVSSRVEDEESWSNVVAGAKAVSSLATFGIVESTSGATSGTVEFHWTVTGNTMLRLDDPMMVNVGEFSARTRLEADFPGMTSSGVLLDELHSLSAEGTVDHETMAGPFIFSTSWTGSDPVPAFFDLETEVKLDMSPTMVGQGSFVGELATDFNNTATLEVVIRDAGGMIIEGASFTPVPEPSSFTFFGLLCLAGGFARWRQNVA